MCEGLNLLYVLQNHHKKLPLVEMKERFLLKHLKLQKCVVMFSLRQEKGHSLSTGQTVYSALANTVVGTSQLLLLKSHFLTRHYESSDSNNNKKMQQTSVAEKFQHMQWKWQAHTSPL